ncbi:hypothetical protein Trco_007176 [Trichoderma cornu-damae]|uniref:Major facilitator superfamily (MFS) profile domain-containing protein n=1 Tax=Trichoderma cornu-damae TaxID=654480 RepID=A0A9P8TVP6_9HYPO|nr:hypothetical protein Trco_007176 [Trichoderma cornu-damae]
MELDAEVAAEKPMGLVSMTPTSVTTNAADTVSSAEYRKLIWKLDVHLLPPLFVLWFISLIDRVNIGTARIQGLEKDLGMNPLTNQFNIATARTSIRLMRYSYRVGIFTIGQGLLNNFAGLVAIRLVIGILEAGLIPGSIFLLSAYYPRYELQWRVSMLHVGNALSNAFGGLLAYAVASIHSSNGWSGWRWIFVIEGLITIVLTLLCWPFMNNWPATAKWLKSNEKAALEERIRVDGIIGRMDVLDRKAVIRCLTDWKIYLSAFIIIGIISSVYSCTLFAPTIILVLKPGYTAKQIQSLVIPIFIAASISTLTFAYISDKLKHRAGVALTGCFIAIIGYIILLSQEHVSVNARYGALYLIALGSFAALPGAWILLLNNVSGSYKTAFAMGMEIGLGNGGGFVASFSFPSKAAPFYWTGFKTTCSLMSMAIGLICIYVVGLWYENRQKQLGKRDHLLDEEGDNLGDSHPEFIYTY